MYYNAYFCVECDKELSWHKMMNSYGRCPHCGFKSPLSATVVKCNERGYEFVRNNVSWFKFWKKHYNREFMTKEER